MPPEKKPVGRPATGRIPQISLRIPRDTLDEIRRWRINRLVEMPDRAILNTSDAIRELLNIALRREKRRLGS